EALADDPVLYWGDATAGPLPARLDEEYVDAGFDELLRDRSPTHSRADDADPGLQAVFGPSPCVDQQRSPPAPYGQEGRDAVAVRAPGALLPDLNLSQPDDAPGVSGPGHVTPHNFRPRCGAKPGAQMRIPHKARHGLPHGCAGRFARRIEEQRGAAVL